MNWLISQLNQIINISEIPVLDFEVLRSDLILQFQANKRLVAFFGQNVDSRIKIYVILADDKNSQLNISSAIFDEKSSYNSLSSEIPAFHMFEREFYEDFGILPLNHPWLKPIRNHSNNYPFFQMEGEETHEVAVGPIHAGIIEPGHFRFLCNGEKVYDLEIKLGYQYRNIESLFLTGLGLNSNLAESIVGDTVIGHNLAHANTIETLMNIQVSDRAILTRLIALELERIAMHIGDLSAISGDIAYLMGNSVWGAARTYVINTMLKLCGSRFGRGLIRVGGVRYNIDKHMNYQINMMLDSVLKDVDRIAKAMFCSASVLSRLEKTGTLNNEKAVALGIVGMAARASHVPLDVRLDYPNKWYRKIGFDKILLAGADVYSRTYIRYLEIKQSADIIKYLLKELTLIDEGANLMPSNKNLSTDSMVVSMIEGWRGEIVHVAITDNNGKLSRYKIKDPSFNNWYGVAVAVRNNDISDFPLCNKSFNLSYCGNDL